MTIKKTVSRDRGEFVNVRAITSSADDKRYEAGELIGKYDHLSDTEIELLLKQGTLERVVQAAPAAKGEGE